jgi:hypothetical protein
MNTKPLLHSKTVWFNTSFAFIAILTAGLNLAGYADFKPDAEVIEGVALFIALGNIGLRRITNTAVR